VSAPRFADGGVTEREVVVAERCLVAEDVVALTLVAADGSPLPGWSPGAHVDLLLRDVALDQADRRHRGIVAVGVIA